LFWVNDQVSGLSDKFKPMGLRAFKLQKEIQ
jgi:hypothetical protein